MKNRLITLTNTLRASYWFIPALMGVAAILLAQFVVTVDENLSIPLADELAWVYRSSPSGVRSVLSTIASSMITVAGVVFSLTMVVLSLTSQQYGSLVLENFMRNRANQIVLGTFTSTFIYCLLVLRTIQDAGDSTFIPRIASIIGVILAILSLAVLIYFIHHTSESIQATTITARVGSDLSAAIDSLFPEEVGRHADAVVDEANGRPPEPPRDLEAEGRTVRATISGYLQLVNGDKLLTLAQEHDLVVKLDLRPGDFVIAGSHLGHIYPYTHANDTVVDAFRRALKFGSGRTQAQDVRLLFEQLVEIAVRALSPGINAPFTAVIALGYIGAGLADMGHRRIPRAIRYDEEGRVRVIAAGTTFANMLDLAFDQIRHYSQSDLTVATYLLDTLARLQESLGETDHGDAVRQYARRTWVAYHSSFTAETERHALARAYSPFDNSTALLTSIQLTPAAGPDS